MTAGPSDFSARKCNSPHIIFRHIIYFHRSFSFVATLVFCAGRLRPPSRGRQGGLGQPAEVPEMIRKYLFPQRFALFGDIQFRLPVRIHFGPISSPSGLPFRVYFESILVNVGSHFRTIPGPFLAHLSPISGQFRVHSGLIWLPVRVHFGSIPGSFRLPFRIHSGSMLNPFWHKFRINFGSVSDHFWLPIRVDFESIPDSVWLPFRTHFGPIPG